MKIGELKKRLNNLLKLGCLSYFSGLLTVLIIPVHINYIPPFMGLWLLCWILENYSRLNYVRSTKIEYRTLFVLFILFYLWQLAGLLYSDDLKMGFLNLFGRLSLVLFPIVLIFPGEMIKKNVTKMLRIFAIGTVIIMLFRFGYALYRSISLQDGTLIFNPHPPEYFWLNYFYGTELAIKQHPTYISMYVLLSIFICFEAMFEDSLKLGKKIFWLFVSIILLVSQYFLSSRSGILVTFLLVIIYFILKYFKSKKFFIILVSILLITIALLPVIRKNQRINDLYKSLVNSREINQKSLDPRTVVWKSALGVAKQHILMGVGIGDARNELFREYKRIGENGTIATERYNAHNQFLEVLLESGMIGVMIFISILGIMILVAFSEKNLLYGLFICMICLFFMIETILYRFAGVSFFSLFSFLLLYYKPDSKAN